MSDSDNDNDVEFVQHDQPLIKRSRYYDDVDVESSESSDDDDDEEEDDSFVVSDHDSLVSNDDRNCTHKSETADWSSIISGLRNRRQFLHAAQCPNCAKYVRYLAKYVQKLSTIQ